MKKKKKAQTSAICAFLTAVIVFVRPFDAYKNNIRSHKAKHNVSSGDNVPGPAVTMATPGMPVMRATASAAKTVAASSRMSTTRIPTAFEAHSMGAM